MRTNSKLSIGVTAVAAAFALNEPAHAHHSYANYDQCASVSIEGEIQHVSWGNPHVWMRLTTVEATRYNVIWFDLRKMRLLGIEAGRLRAGDRVVITGSSHRDPEQHLIALVTEVRRSSDGWAGSADSPGTASRAS